MKKFLFMLLVAMSSSAFAAEGDPMATFYSSNLQQQYQEAEVYCEDASEPYCESNPDRADITTGLIAPIPFFPVNANNTTNSGLKTAQPLFGSATLTKHRQVTMTRVSDDDDNGYALSKVTSYVTVQTEEDADVCYVHTNVQGPVRAVSNVSFTSAENHYPDFVNWYFDVSVDVNIPAEAAGNTVVNFLDSKVYVTDDCQVEVAYNAVTDKVVILQTFFDAEGIHFVKTNAISLPANGGAAGAGWISWDGVIIDRVRETVAMVISTDAQLDQYSRDDDDAARTDNTYIYLKGTLQKCEESYQTEA